jgi:hypothetical protein
LERLAHRSYLAEFPAAVKNGCRHPGPFRIGYSSYKSRPVRINRKIAAAKGTP